MYDKDDSANNPIGDESTIYIAKLPYIMRLKLSNAVVM
jgi:hypothetical protein